MNVDLAIAIVGQWENKETFETYFVKIGSGLKKFYIKIVLVKKINFYFANLYIASDRDELSQKCKIRNMQNFMIYSMEFEILKSV